MKIFIKYIILCFLLQSCFVPRFSRYKSFDNDSHPTITREVSWGSGGGMTGKGPSRVNVLEKTFDKDEKIISKSKRKVKYYGCSGLPFYEKTKYYDLNGRVNKIIVFNNLGTTTILINESGQKTTTFKSK